MDESVLELVRQHMREVKTPGHYDKVRGTVVGLVVGCVRWKDAIMFVLPGRVCCGSHACWAACGGPHAMPTLPNSVARCSYMWHQCICLPPLPAGLQGRVHVLLRQPPDARRALHQPDHAPGGRAGAAVEGECHEDTLKQALLPSGLPPQICTPFNIVNLVPHLNHLVTAQAFDEEHVELDQERTGAVLYLHQQARRVS